MSPLPLARFRRKIGAKLLAVILPCMMLGAVTMFLTFESYAHENRIIALKARLDSFTLTQGPALIKPVWEFDNDTLTQVFQGYQDVPELLSAELRDAQGAVIAHAVGQQIDGYQESFIRQTPLVKRTKDGDYPVGQLTVRFHDGFVLRQIATEKVGGLVVLGLVFLLLGATVLVSVRRMVADPLRRLQNSLLLNAQAESRQPLTWRGEDELGDVVTAYNRLLTEIDQRQRDIHHIAYHDTLTGLPNRRLLEDRLNHAITVAERQGRGIAVLFTDVDNFKVINESLGHEVGDALLKVIADRMVRAVRTMDTVARWGGDEFVVVLENVSGPGEASSVAEKLIDIIGQPITLGDNLLRVGGSIGISLYPQDGRDVTALMKNADLALFEAKGAGRNTLHFFNEAMNLRAYRRLEVEAALRNGITQNELELHYQPKVGIADGRLIGVEALVRWRRPGDGLVPPDQFIPVAEESDLIILIGEWVLKEACAQILRWRAAGLPDVHVAINLSPRHFRNASAVDDIIAVVEAAGVPPRLLEIELTEATVMQDPDRTIEYLCRLRDYGFSIAIDDFGTGYSNLNYLRQLPISTLKIDRSFVKDIESDKGDAEIIRTIIAMANVLGLGLVAEGVETEGQLGFLHSCACDAAQGYYFAKPLPPAQFDEWLRGRGLAPPLTKTSAKTTPIGQPALASV